MSEFYKDWNSSKSQNNNGAVPFYRPIDLTPEEKEQACKNIGVASNDAIERLEGEFTDLRGDMAVVEGNVNTSLTAVNDAVTAANDAVTAANAALSQVSTVIEDVDTISAKADSNSDNIFVLSGKVDNNIANIVALSGKNTVQDNRLDVLDNKVAGLTNSATYHDAKIQNLENDWTTYSADLRNDFNTFSATEDAVITAATAAIPGQVSAEVSGQLSGKQDKLTPGVNISLTTAGVIDVKNNECSAIGSYGVAIGYHTSANGYCSFAQGGNSNAVGYYSHVEGESTKAIGQFSHAEGKGTSALSPYSHAEGEGTRAYRVAHAEGRMTSAANDYSHAEGSETLTKGVCAHAEGNKTSALSSYSHAEGQYTITDTIGQHVEGKYNAPAAEALHVIGNGTSNANRSNIVETYSDRVVVNGKNTNGYMQAVEELSNWVYDSTTGTKIQFDRPDFAINPAVSSISGKKIGTNWFGPTYLSGPNQYYLTNGKGGAIGITRWDGIPRRALSVIGNNSTTVSSCPGELPMTLSADLSYFAFANPYVRNIDEQFTNIRDLIDVGVEANNAFRGTSISADVVPLMDYIINAGYQSRWKSAFKSCYYIPNYSTLIASPTYSSFF